MRKVAFALLLAAAPALAQQDYPNKPIRLITPAAQGGTTDILARIFGQKLGEVLKQSVVVDNRASAAGVIAGQMTASAPPDGYTLLLAYHQHTVNAALNPKLPYHPVDSFTPITQLTSAGLMLVVNPSAPVNNLAEFIAWTKNFKGSLNFGSAGIGSGGHLAGELFKMLAGVTLTHVPYRGNGPALTALLGGQVEVLFASLPSSLEYIRTGKVRALGITSAKRSEAQPDLPTIAESVAGYDMSAWYGASVPKGTPAEVIDLLNREINAGLADPKTMARLAEQGGISIAGSPADFGKFIADETEKWGKVVRFAGMKPE